MHVPTRTCVGCGAKKAPSEMLRIASKDGAAPQLVTDNRADGRSAYLCREANCVEKAFLRRALERSLKLKNPTPQPTKDEIVRAANASAECGVRSAE